MGKERAAELRALYGKKEETTTENSTTVVNHYNINVVNQAQQAYGQDVFIEQEDRTIIVHETYEFDPGKFYWKLILTIMLFGFAWYRAMPRFKQKLIERKIHMTHVVSPVMKDLQSQISAAGSSESSE